MVLSTDMSFHKRITNTIELNILDKPFNIDYKVFLLSVIVHAADISNPTRPNAVTVQWAQVYGEEIMQLGEKRLKIGLPIAPSPARDTFSLPKNQIGFINFIIQPFFLLLSRVFDISDAISNIEENLQYWKSNNI